MKHFGAQVIVITGPPGAGKTTVARALAPASRRPAVHLHADDFWRCIRSGWIAPFLAEAHRQNQVVIEVLAQAAFGYAAGGYLVVLDGIVGPWFLEPFRGRGRQAQIPLRYVVLRPDLETTIQRAAGRAGDALRDPAPIRSLHAQFSDLGPLEGNVLDNSDDTSADTARRVRDALTSTRYLLDTGSSGR